MLKEGRFWDRGLGCPETGIRTRDGSEWSPETHYLRGGFWAVLRRLTTGGRG